MEATTKALESLPGHRRTRPDAVTVEIAPATLAECARIWRAIQDVETAGMEIPAIDGDEK